MSRQLDFFLFLGSTYTYLAVNRAEELTARENITLRWRPFSVRSIMFEQNNRPFVGKPVKLAYMWRDLERRAQRHGIAFESAPIYPIDADELANRTATVAAQEGWCPEFAKAAYAKWFIENKDPGKVEHLTEVLEKLGKDAGDVLRRAEVGASAISTPLRRRRLARWASSVHPPSCMDMRSSGATIAWKMRLNGAPRTNRSRRAVRTVTAESIRAN